MAATEKNVSFTLAEFPNQDDNELGLFLIYDILRSQNGEENFAVLLEQYKK
jgi:hypothetical protein